MKPSSYKALLLLVVWFAGCEGSKSPVQGAVEACVAGTLAVEPALVDADRARATRLRLDLESLGRTKSGDREYGTILVTYTEATRDGALLSVRLTAYDDAGSVVATGTAETVVAKQACNRLQVVLGEPRNECVNGCTRAPANRCENDTTLRVFEPRGVCNTRGICNFGYVPTVCPHGCKDGACGDEPPCARVSCNAPPGARCEGGSTLIAYESVGVCEGEGVCRYKEVRTLCERGCTGAACNGDPCAAVTCNTPPAPACASPTLLKTHAATGVCGGGGTCTYAATDTPCANGCADGRCRGVCEGVSCTENRAPTCDGAVLVSYSSPGFCQSATGKCDYSPQRRACQNGCESGACRPLCAGVVCNSPPPPTCDGAVKVTRAQAGTCVDATGLCQYEPTRETCLFGCQAGACNRDPCAGVTCTTPPSKTCEGTKRIQYASPGTCNAATGACTYPRVEESCAHGCTNGICNGVPNPCAEVLCNTPPLPTCDAGSLLSYAATGTCEPGREPGVAVCSYLPTRTSCPHGCANRQCKACVRACGGRVCGDDGCAGTCGECGTAEVCNAGACVPLNPPGTKKWEFATGAAIASSPAIGSDGTVYVGSRDGKFYALYGHTPLCTTCPWPKFHHNNKNTGNVATPLQQ